MRSTRRIDNDKYLEYYDEKKKHLIKTANNFLFILNRLFYIIYLIIIYFHNYSTCIIYIYVKIYKLKFIDNIILNKLY